MKSLQKQILFGHFRSSLLSGVLTVFFMYYVIYPGLVSVGAGLFIGISIYLLIALIKQNLINKYFRKTNLFIFLFIQAIVNVVVIVGIALIGVGIFYMNWEFGHLFRNFFNVFTGIEGKLGLVFGLLLNFFFIFYSIINTLIGKNVLGKLFIGRYRAPFEVDRVFMFLDIKSSTAMAEKIGHKKFMSLINDFFFDIVEPINKTRGEIYKYVGDEVIISWNTKNAFHHSNCLECFFGIEEQIKARSAYYLKAYGMVPEFKAGLHGGIVITGELGYTKREIAFMGDVLNTAARIEQACKTYQHKLLISEELADQFTDLSNFKLHEIDGVLLRGKENKMKLFGVSR